MGERHVLLEFYLIQTDILLPQPLQPLDRKLL